MSNPFRRKLSGDTPSASVRTSLDIDEARIQQVAEQAFSPLEYTFPMTIKPPTATLESSNTSPLAAVTAVSESTVAAAEVVRPEIRASPASSPAAKPPAPISPPNRKAVPPAPPAPRGILRKTAQRAAAELGNDKDCELESRSIEVVPPIPTTDPFSEATATEQVEETDEPSDSESEAEASLDGSEAPESPLQSENIAKDEEEAIRIEPSDKYGPIEPSEKYNVGNTPTPKVQPVEPSPILAANPFRLKDKELSPRRRSLETDDPPRFTGLVRQNSEKKGVRQSLDVDAFKHLMLTGQTKPSPSSESTENSNLSRQSLFESIPEQNATGIEWTPRTSQDTPRTSHEISAAEEERKLPTTVRNKPPLPKPRGTPRIGGKINSTSSPSPPPARGHLTEVAPDAVRVVSTPVVENVSPESLNRRLSFQRTTSENLETLSPRPTLSQNKTPPTPPLARRISTHITSYPPVAESTASKSGALYPSKSPIIPVIAPSPRAPPPPPPTRRGGPVLPSQETEALSLPTQNKPELPPARRSSKRISVRPPARTVNSSSLQQAQPPPPPPPPSRRRSQLVTSRTDVEVETEREQHEEEEKRRKSADILDDLTKLQREVDELRGRYE